MSPRLAAAGVAICLLAGLPDQARSQSLPPYYSGALSGGRAFMTDNDSRDPPGSSSVSAAVERRRPDRAMSVGVEAGIHRYLRIRQDLSPDITGWSNTIEDTRRAWRVTPYVRWRTRGAVGVYAQAGAGVYGRNTSYFQQEREGDEVVYETSYEISQAKLGLNLGVGLELFVPGTPIGVGAGYRAHASGGDGFSSAEIGVVWRLGASSRGR